jgi:hypothetical protein
VWGLASALFAAILAARAQWSVGELWPSTAVHRLPSEPFASNVWATWFNSTSFVFDVEHGVTNGWTNHWMADIQVDRLATNLWGWWQSPAGRTNWAETNGLMAYDPGPDDFVFTQVFWIASTSIEWGETNLTLTGGAADRMAWESYEAGFERFAAAFGYAISAHEEGYEIEEEPWFVVTNTYYTTNLHRRVDVVGPRYYRSERDALVAAKQTIAALAPHHVIPCPSNGYETLAAWSEANPTNDFPPMWTPAGLVASNGLPAGWLTSTPWRFLHGEGTNVPQWDGVRRCLNCLVWTKRAAVWQGTNSYWNSQRSSGPHWGAEGYAYETYAEAVANAASNGPAPAPDYRIEGSGIGVYRGGHWSTEWPDEYPEGDPVLTGFHADASCGRGRLGTGTVANLRSATVEIYTRASAIGELDWGGDATWPTNGAWALAASLTAQANGVFVHGDWVGHAGLGHPGYAPEPPSDTNDPPAFTSASTNFGYLLSEPVIIFRHDVDGGLLFR